MPPVLVTLLALVPAAARAARKWEVAYGFRLAPFYASRYGFLRTLRVESAAIWMYRPDARESVLLAIPILPYFYWQWRW